MSGRLPFVEAVKAKGKVYLYYRREGRRVALPGPEGSPEFLAAYDTAHRDHGLVTQPVVSTHTVSRVVRSFLTSADFFAHRPSTQRSYESFLKPLDSRAGNLPLDVITTEWASPLRNRHAGKGHTWNQLRAKAAMAWDAYLAEHPDAPRGNPWRATKRIRIGQSDRNRAWPDEVILAVLRASTPEFRAVIMTMLLTSQRIGDVCRFEPSQYDRATKTLRFRQGKTGEMMALDVPSFLAETFERMAGRVPGRMLCTPRGMRWTPDNAQEHLQVLRRNLELDYYVLHGLRATGPTALAMQGTANRTLRALTGHRSDATLEIYLRGVQNLQLARPAQQQLEKRFAPVITAAAEGENTRKFTGLTGRAAAKARRLAESQTADKRQTDAEMLAKKPTKPMASPRGFEPLLPP